jgi:branched-chain amino acid transport system ATP-binding protein
MTERATTPALEVEGVTVRFGGVTALDGVSFTVNQGSLSALIGPNGAGKTSLFNCLSGIYKPTEGRIRLHGTEITGLPQHKIARLGLARTFQSPALFQGLTVLENLMTGRYLHGRGGMIAGLFRLPFVVDDEVKQRRRVEEILELLEISHLRHKHVTDLAYGVQKRVELGRALAQDPKVLILDEPMAGMTVDEKEDMSAFILASREELGNTVLLIEHDMGVVMDIAEHVVVLDFGRKIGDGTPDEVRRNEAVVAAYLGADSGAAEPAIQGETR